MTKQDKLPSLARTVSLAQGPTDMIARNKQLLKQKQSAGKVTGKNSTTASKSGSSPPPRKQNEKQPKTSPSRGRRNGPKEGINDCYLSTWSTGHTDPNASSYHEMQAPLFCGVSNLYHARSPTKQKVTRVTKLKSLSPMTVSSSKRPNLQEDFVAQLRNMGALLRETGGQEVSSEEKRERLVTQIGRLMHATTQTQYDLKNTSTLELLPEIQRQVDKMDDQIVGGSTKQALSNFLQSVALGASAKKDSYEISPTEFIGGSCDFGLPERFSAGGQVGAHQQKLFPFSASASSFHQNEPYSYDYSTTSTTAVLHDQYPQTSQYGQFAAGNNPYQQQAFSGAQDQMMLSTSLSHSVTGFPPPILEDEIVTDHDADQPLSYQASNIDRNTNTNFMAAANTTTSSAFSNKLIASVMSQEDQSHDSEIGAGGSTQLSGSVGTTSQQLGAGLGAASVGGAQLGGPGGHHVLASASTSSNQGGVLVQPEPSLLGTTLGASTSGTQLHSPGGRAARRGGVSPSSASRSPAVSSPRSRKPPITEPYIDGHELKTPIGALVLPLGGATIDEHEPSFMAQELEPEAGGGYLRPAPFASAGTNASSGLNPISRGSRAIETPGALAAFPESSPVHQMLAQLNEAATTVVPVEETIFGESTWVVHESVDKNLLPDPLSGMRSPAGSPSRKLRRKMTDNENQDLQLDVSKDKVSSPLQEIVFRPGEILNLPTTTGPSGAPPAAAAGNSAARTQNKTRQQELKQLRAEAIHEYTVPTPGSNTSSPKRKKQAPSREGLTPQKRVIRAERDQLASPRVGSGGRVVSVQYTAAAAPGGAGAAVASTTSPVTGVNFRGPRGAPEDKYTSDDSVNLNKSPARASAPAGMGGGGIMSGAPTAAVNKQQQQAGFADSNAGRRGVIPRESGTAPAMRQGGVLLVGNQYNYATNITAQQPHPIVFHKSSSSSRRNENEGQQVLFPPPDSRGSLYPELQSAAGEVEVNLTKNNPANLDHLSIDRRSVGERERINSQQQSRELEEPQAGTSLNLLHHQLPSEDTTVAFTSPEKDAGVVSPLGDVLAGVPKKGQKYEELFDPGASMTHGSMMLAFGGGRDGPTNSQLELQQFPLSTTSLQDPHFLQMNEHNLRNSFLVSHSDLMKSSVLTQQQGSIEKSNHTDFAEDDYCFEILPEKELGRVVHYRRQAMTQTAIHAPTCGCYKCYQKARYDGQHLSRKFFRPRNAEELTYQDELKKLSQMQSPRSWSKTTTTTLAGNTTTTRVHLSGSLSASLTTMNSLSVSEKEQQNLRNRSSSPRMSGNNNSQHQALQPAQQQGPHQGTNHVNKQKAALQHTNLARSIVTTTKPRRFFVPQASRSEQTELTLQERAMLLSRGSQAGVDTDLESLGLLEPQYSGNADHQEEGQGSYHSRYSGPRAKRTGTPGSQTGEEDVEFVPLVEPDKLQKLVPLVDAQDYYENGAGGQDLGPGGGQQAGGPGQLNRTTQQGGSRPPRHQTGAKAVPTGPPGAAAAAGAGKNQESGMNYHDGDDHVDYDSRLPTSRTTRSPQHQPGRPSNQDRSIWGDTVSGQLSIEEGWMQRKLVKSPQDLLNESRTSKPSTGDSDLGTVDTFGIPKKPPRKTDSRQQRIHDRKEKSAFSTDIQLLKQEKTESVSLKQEIEKRLSGDPVLHKKLKKAERQIARQANANYGKAVAKKIVDMGPNGMVEMLGQLSLPIKYDKNGKPIREYHSVFPTFDANASIAFTNSTGSGARAAPSSMAKASSSTATPAHLRQSLESVLEEQQRNAQEITQFLKNVIPMEGDDDESEDEVPGTRTGYRREKRTKPPQPGGLGFLDSLPFAEDLKDGDGLSWVTNLRNVAPREDTAEREKKEKQQVLEDLLAGRERAKVNEKEFDRFVTVLRTQLVREVETLQFREHSVRTYLHEWLLENWADQRDIYSLKQWYKQSAEKLGKVLRENEILFGSQNLEENSVFPVLQSLVEGDKMRDPMEFAFLAERKQAADYQPDSPLPSDGEGGFAGFGTNKSPDPFPNLDDDECWGVLTKMQKFRNQASKEYRKELITRRMEKMGPLGVEPYVTIPVYKRPSDDEPLPDVQTLLAKSLTAGEDGMNNSNAGGGSSSSAMFQLSFEEEDKKLVKPLFVSNEWLSKRGKHEGVTGKNVDDMFRAVFFVDRVCKESNFVKPSKKARLALSTVKMNAGYHANAVFGFTNNAVGDKDAENQQLSSPTKAAHAGTATSPVLTNLPSPSRNVQQGRKMASPGGSTGPTPECAALLRAVRAGREKIPPDYFGRQRLAYAGQYLCEFGSWPMLDPGFEGDGEERAAAEAAAMRARQKAKKEGKEADVPKMPKKKKAALGIVQELSVRQWVVFLKKHCGKKSTLRDRVREFSRRFAVLHKENFAAGFCMGSKVCVQNCNEWFHVAAQRLIAFRGTGMTGVTSWNVAARGDKRSQITMVLRIEGDQDQLKQLPRRRLRKRTVPYGDSRDAPRGLVSIQIEDLLPAARQTSPGTTARLALGQQSQSPSPAKDKDVNKKKKDKELKTSQSSRPESQKTDRPDTKQSSKSNRSDFLMHANAVPELSTVESILMQEDAATLRKMQAQNVVAFNPAKRVKTYSRSEKKLGRENLEGVKFRRDMPLEGKGKNFLLHLLPTDHRDLSDEDDVTEALVLPEEVPDLRWPRADTGLVLQTRQSQKRRQRELKFYEQDDSKAAKRRSKKPPKEPVFGGGRDFAWTQKPAWGNERKLLLFGDDYRYVEPEPEESSSSSSSANESSGEQTGTEKSAIVAVNTAGGQRAAQMSGGVSSAEEEEEQLLLAPRITVIWNRLHRRPARPERYDYTFVSNGPCKWKKPLEKTWMLRQAEVFGRYRAMVQAQAAQLGQVAAEAKKPNRFGDLQSSSFSEQSGLENAKMQQARVKQNRKKFLSNTEKVAGLVREKVKREDEQWTPRGLHTRNSSDEVHDSYSNLLFMTVTVKGAPLRPAGMAVMDDDDDGNNEQQGGGGSKQEKLKGEHELQVWASSTHEHMMKTIGAPDVFWVHNGISLLPFLAGRYGKEFLDWWVHEKGEEAALAFFGSAPLPVPRVGAMKMLGNNSGFAAGAASAAIQDSSQMNRPPPTSPNKNSPNKTFLTQGDEPPPNSPEREKKTVSVVAGTTSGSSPAPGGNAAGGGGTSSASANNKPKNDNAPGSLVVPDTNWNGVCGLVGRFRFDKQNFYEVTSQGNFIDPVFPKPRGHTSSSSANASRNASGAEGALVAFGGGGNGGDEDDLDAITDEQLRVKRYMYRLTPAELPAEPILAMKDIAPLFSRVNLRMELQDCLDYRREYAQKTAARYAGNSPGDGGSSAAALQRKKQLKENQNRQGDLRGLSLRKLEEKRGKDLWFDKVRLQGSKRMEAEHNRLEKLKFEISDIYAAQCQRAYKTDESNLFQVTSKTRRRRILQDDSSCYSDSSVDTADGWENPVDRVRFSLPPDDDSEDEFEYQDRLAAPARSRIFESEDEGPWFMRDRKRQMRRERNGNNGGLFPNAATVAVVAQDNSQFPAKEAVDGEDIPDNFGLEQLNENSKPGTAERENAGEQADEQAGKKTSSRPQSGATKEAGRKQQGGQVEDGPELPAAVVAIAVAQNSNSGDDNLNATSGEEQQTATHSSSTTEEEELEEDELTLDTHEESNLLSFCYSESAREVFKCHKSRHVFNRGYLHVVRLKRRRTFLYRCFQYTARYIFALGAGRLGVEELYIYILYLTDRLRSLLIDKKKFAQIYDPSAHPVELLCRSKHIAEIAKLAIIGLNPVSAGIPDLWVKPDDVTPVRGLSRLTLSPIGILDTFVTLANCFGCDVMDLLDIDHGVYYEEQEEIKRKREEELEKLRPPSSKSQQNREVNQGQQLEGALAGTTPGEQEQSAQKKKKKEDGSQSALLSQKTSGSLMGTGNTPYIESFEANRREEFEILQARLRPESRGEGGGKRRRSRESKGYEKSTNKKKHF
ncbi:unnamed protein product [Amoebophrya sp. A120]|nr:unnamed protein product [Amoebophrya sp. A120]|eukprot:GSA120T00014931001.1